MQHCVVVRKRSLCISKGDGSGLGTSHEILEQNGVLFMSGCTTPMEIQAQKEDARNCLDSEEIPCVISCEDKSRRRARRLRPNCFVTSKLSLCLTVFASKRATSRVRVTRWDATGIDICNPTARDVLKCERGQAGNRGEPRARRQCGIPRHTHTGTPAVSHRKTSVHATLFDLHSRVCVPSFRT